jgi:peptide/nickel transport system ATP-binding protein
MRSSTREFATDVAPLLDIRDLRVSFRTRDGVVHAVDGVSTSVDRGKTLGLVGESGSGKSVTALSVIGLTRLPNADVSGQVLFDGVDLLQESSDQLRSIRGPRIAMIFQDPLSSLHPLYRVGWQIEEAILAHEQVSRRAARARAIDAMRAVEMPNPAELVDRYPHELSGGMRQRAMIGMALVLNPDVLIADEPTTALDVTVQAQILELIRSLQHDFDTAVVLITHDFGVIAETADEVAVMYAGRIVEQGPIGTILDAPEHPYTWGLLQSIPRLDTPRRDRLEPIKGTPPSLVHPPGGCHFHPRCPYVMPMCRTMDPELLESDPGHFVACHLPVAEKRRIWQELQPKPAEAA